MNNINNVIKKYIFLMTVFLSIFLFVFVDKVHASNTYYVSSGGQNSGSCIITSPCNFARAQTLAVAGDTVQIQDTIAAINITKAGIRVSGGIVDGKALTSANSASVLISANDVVLEDMEIINGWSYGFRTIANVQNVTARRLNIHHNVIENFSSDKTKCNTSTTNGWGSAMRAYFTDGMVFTDSNIWENCGEGFSAVMSKNIHGERLTIWDNWSVNVYPDQTDMYSLKDSLIYCIKDGFQRNIKSRSFLLGAEGSYGSSVNITKNIALTNNKVYGCRGLSTYSETSGGFNNITVINNTFYNSYDAILGSINGTNIVTSPNSTETINPLPTPQPPSLLPTPTPLPQLKRGDVNKDGYVNIFDYDILVNDFSKTGLLGWISSDIIPNGKIDIYDFNSLISNFGN